MPGYKRRKRSYKKKSKGGFLGLKIFNKKKSKKIKNNSNNRKSLSVKYCYKGCWDFHHFGRYPIQTKNKDCGLFCLTKPEKKGKGKNVRMEKVLLSNKEDWLYDQKKKDKFLKRCKSKKFLWGSKKVKSYNKKC